MDYVDFEDGYLMGALETTFGMSPAMTPAANTVRPLNVASSFQADKSQRNFFQPYRGARPFTLKNKRRPLSFSTDLVGALLGGSTPGPLDPFLRGCGLTRSVLASPAGLRYAPTVGGPDSSVAFELFTRDPNNLNNMIRRVTAGHRGTLTLSFPIDEKPSVDFDFEGNLGTKSSVLAPVADFSAWQDAEDVDEVTTELTINGEAIEGVNYTSVLGYARKNRVSYVRRGRALGSRESTVTFSGFDQGITPLDLEDLADQHNILSVVMLVTSSVLGCTIKLTQRLQLEPPKESNLDGSRGVEVSAVAIPTAAGNTDFILDIF